MGRIQLYCLKILPIATFVTIVQQNVICNCIRDQVQDLHKQLVDNLLNPQQELDQLVEDTSHVDNLGPTQTIPIATTDSQGTSSRKRNLARNPPNNNKRRRKKFTT